LIRPIKYFSQKIAAMNEKALKELDLKNIPIEFKPLATSINQLINKIKSFLEYKKELFVGTAHELKTPLAVMKTKSQVALLKRDKNIKSLEDALRQNIKSIDNMNKVIESILEFGRAEGAQFTQSEEIDLIKFIEEIVDEFKLLGESKKITIKKHLHPKSLQIKIQPLLIRQIIQNFLQNAIRFTPPKKQIVVSSYIKDDNFILKIRDEGEGIEEGIDLFAPFKRSKNSPGTGLGLFLVKSAADSIGGKVFINNRKDGKSGAVATFILPLNKNI
jgi:two-component system OmpR family sensor kinase